MVDTPVVPYTPKAAAAVRRFAACVAMCDIWC